MESISETIRKRGEIEEIAFRLYEKYAKEYQELIPRYTSLLEKKRELGITPLGAIPRDVLIEFPELALLSAKDTEAALNYITETRTLDLKSEIRRINNYVDSVVYVALKSTIISFQYEINTYGKPRTSLCVDMSSLRLFNGRRTHRHVVNDE